MRPSRRQLLAMAGLGGLGGLALPRVVRGADEPRYIVVLGCFGGASMVDCLMPVDLSEAATHANRGTVNSYATRQVGAFRCVDRSTPVRFLERYGHQAIAMGTQSSSVNHFVGQARSINGRDTFAGRTLCEAVSAVYGEQLVLPNVNMGRGGFTEPGADPTLDRRFRAEIVSNPVTFALSTHGTDGVIPLGDSPIEDPELRAQLLSQARELRDGALEEASPYGLTFPNSRARRELLLARRDIDPRLEQEDLIRRLLFVPDLGEILPLEAYGLDSSEQTERIRQVLPGAMPSSTSGTADDRLQAQAALAYLLLTTGTSCAVTLTEPGTDGFLAFDQSHNSHRNAQSTHWDRVLDVAHRLITLLQEAPHADGGSFWDRTLLLFATEFGRDKWDTGSGYGTGHHLNNGVLMVSPLLAGGQVLGEPDPNNGFICGFDPVTGEPTPFDELGPGEDPLFSDERLPPSEEQVYGGICEVLGIQFEGQQTLPIITR